MIVYIFEIDKPFLMEWCEKLPPSDHSFGYCDLSTFIHQIAHNFKNAKLYLFVVEFYPCWASRGILSVLVTSGYVKVTMYIIVLLLFCS